MTRSLAEDLRALAHSGPTDPGAVVADRAGQMVRAIRRRRAARQTGMSAVGVGTAAAVMIGVSQSPGWLTTGPAGEGEPGDTATVTSPPTTSEPSPTESAPTPTPTPTPTDDPTGEPTVGTEPSLTPGLQLIADRYGLDVSCGAPMTYQMLDAVGRGGDHLMPDTDVVPTRADQPLTVLNAIPDNGEAMDGYARMKPVAVITRDGVVVGWGGGDAVGAELERVTPTYGIELDRLHQCESPAMADDGLGTYTIWVLASEAGFGLPDDVEGLGFAAGLWIDLATGTWGDDVGQS